MREEIKSISIGVAGGIGAGLIGIGGGIIMIPCMISFLGLSQHKAQATSLAAIAPLAVVSAAVYSSYGNLNIYLACLLAIGGVIGAYIGSSLMPYVNANILKRILAVICIFTAIKMGVGF
ncbi:MAG: sulfite exporter TauE/SafE family protein [Bacillota bacterium]|nr:sulfite exporter TauE/SafE family protein [Bacillota bacterium]